MTTTTYNGWKNYQTWNVILWISNDEGLYNLHRECKTYEQFCETLKEIGGEIAFQTPDGVAWNDSGLDLDAIADFWNEE